MNKGKTIALTIIGTFLLISLIIGISYSLWRVNLFQTTANTIQTDCFNITFTEGEAIELLNTYPMYDEDGSKLTPYTFTIKNNCASYATYQINLEVLNNSTLNDQYLKVMLDEKSPKLLTNYQEGEITLDDAKASYVLENDALDHNEEKTYNLRIWLDENVTLETGGVQNSTWSAKVTITAKYSDHLPTDYEKCIMEYGEGTFLCNVIANLDSEKCPTVNDDGTIEVTNSESTDGYVCSAPDDYGMSYYYRGNVTNNYVYFAGYYWRILRVNGDGSIRIIYDGTSAHENGEASEDRTIGQSKYNDEIIYEGFETFGSDKYVLTTGEDSIIKTYIDEWYEENLAMTENESFIVDNIFCNDSTILSGDPNELFSHVVFRWYYGPWDNENKNLPRFKCPKDGAYTVNDLEVGNGLLNHAIGLISADEAVLAGVYKNISGNLQTHYLYTGNGYWTMSPRDFSSGTRIVGVSAFGALSTAPGLPITTGNYIKPVINLKPNSLNSGDGTASNPYTIK